MKTDDPNDIVDEQNEITAVQDAFDRTLGERWDEDADWTHEQLRGGNIRISGIPVSEATDLAASVAATFTENVVHYDYRTYGATDPDHVTITELTNVRAVEVTEDISDDQLLTHGLGGVLADEFDIEPNGEDGALQVDVHRRRVACYSIEPEDAISVVKAIGSYATANSHEAAVGGVGEAGIEFDLRISADTDGGVYGVVVDDIGWTH